MSSRPHQQPVTLTAFDPITARAVVAVLRRAGIAADVVGGPDAVDELEVTVPDGTRDRAMRVLGERMEEVREAVAGTTTTADPGARGPRDASEPSRSTPPPDPDDVHAGPPLVMERFRNLSWLGAILLVPMLAVTIAGPLRGELRIVAAVILMGIVAALIWRRRSGR